MAVIYLRSTDGNNSDDGSTWALAKATLSAALTAAGAGGTVYVSQVHAETQATSMSLTSPGTAASPVTVLCVNDGAAPPTALAATATVTTTGTAGITFLGFAYCYGIIFSAGDSGGATFNFGGTAPWWWRFDTCALRRASGNVGVFSFGTNATSTDDQLIELVNTTFQFSHTGDTVSIECPFRWWNTPTALTGSQIPNTLFYLNNGGMSAWAEIKGVDLSAAGSGKTLVNVSTGNFGRYLFENCKLGASVAITTGTVPGQGGHEVWLINCDSADTNYRYYKQNYTGTITQETTIVRTGGASDGTTPISRKMVTTANSKFYKPLESDPIVYWNETIDGSTVTVTVEVVTDNVTLTDAQAWVEVEYLGTSGFPLTSTVRDRATNILSTPANQTSSSVTWTTTGLATPVKQKLSIGFIPLVKGPVRIYVMLAKASTTMYFCPEADIT